MKESIKYSSGASFVQGRGKKKFGNEGLCIVNMLPWVSLLRNNVNERRIPRDQKPNKSISGGDHPDYCYERIPGNGPQFGIRRLP